MEKNRHNKLAEAVAGTIAVALVFMVLVTVVYLIAKVTQ